MKILILNQAFYPDVVSTSQHASDLARHLVLRGHSVTVISSSRAYDDPHTRFPARETWNGIKIVRLRCTGFGKKSKWRRAVDFGTYIFASLIRLLFVGHHDVVIALTSPPLISCVGALFTWMKGGRFVFWVMDMNPDEAIAAGWLKQDSSMAKLLGWMLRFSMKRASLVIALDRFMQQRIHDKGIVLDKILVVPPWSHDDAVRFDHAGRDAFRTEHGIQDKFVVMYSGNHSPCHPLGTLLAAAEELSSHEQIRFCFVGGGSEFIRVQKFAAEKGLTNILCLPYQPLCDLARSLSAADLHVVVMGDAFRGIVHPCKIYNILALGTPFLYIGPQESHVGDILREFAGLRAFAAAHGDASRVSSQILEASRGCSAQFHVDTQLTQRYAKGHILPVLAAAIEKIGDPARVASSSRVRD